MRRIDEMRRSGPARSWLPLYVAFAVVLGMLWLERHASLTPTDHTIALLTVLAIFFVVTWLWLGTEERR